MTTGRDPFRLEDDEQAPDPAQPRPGVPGADGRPRVRPPGPSSGERVETPEIDVRTVAERLGRAPARLAGQRPPPAGWPLEALAFPLRRPGPADMLAGAAVLVLLDILGWWNVFAGLVLKAFALFFLLRWQIHVASTSAGGRDAPSSWMGAIELSRDDLRALGRFVVGFAVVTALVLALLAWASPTAGWVALALGVYGLSAWALALAVHDPRVARPDVASGWILRHPVGLLVGAAGWAAAGAIEWWLATRPATTLLGAALGSVGLRAGLLYLWLVSARALGIVGRAWTPAEEDPEAGEGG